MIGTFDLPIFGSITPLVISTGGRLTSAHPITCTTGLAVPASQTSVANDIVYVPFWVPQTATFVSAYVYNGSATAGNVDVAVYDTAGNRLGSCGSTARSGNSTIQRIALSASLTLTPGVYYMATVTSTSAANVTFGWASNTNNARWCGLMVGSAAPPLASSVSFSTWAARIIPLFGIGQQAF